MCKYILVLLSVVTVMVLFNLSDVVAQKQLPPFIEECKKSEKATDDDMKNLKNQTLPRTKEMKCLLTCFGEKSGKIVNSKLDKDAMLNSIKTSPNYTEAMQQNVTAVVDECSKIASDPDRCENGSKLMDCLLAGAEKRGVKAVFDCGN